MNFYNSTSLCVMCNAYANMAQNLITPVHFSLINVKSLR